MNCTDCNKPGVYVEFQTFKYWWCDECEAEIANCEEASVQPVLSAPQAPTPADATPQPDVACLWCGYSNPHACPAFKEEQLNLCMTAPF